METVTVRMARGDRATSWGFGVTEAPNRDVIIVNVVGGSLADRAGLRNGDILDQLEGLGNLDINAVDRLLITSRDKIELVVHRHPSGGQARIWRPEITDQRGYSGQAEERPFKVSLEHNNDTRPPQGFNSAALPFNTDPRVKHLQYNSPMGLYSDESATEQYVQQTAGIIDNGVVNIPRQTNEPAYLRSETLRLVKEEEGKPKGNLSDHPNPNGLPVCFVCTRPILGMMARAAGHDLHADCLSCATCGSSLRNIGHHFIEDKFYCDVHGRQKKGLGPVMDPSLAAKNSAVSGQPVRATDGDRSFYQPEVMARRPLSVSPTSQHTTTHIHYGTPKTQGTLSPSLRGIPSSANYGAGHHVSGGALSSDRIVTARPVQVQHQEPNPPPVPTNPPPESRVPSSVRSAVSPKRSGRSLIQWPPPVSLPTLRYWQIDPASVSRKQRQNEPISLQSMIEASDREAPKLSSNKRLLKSLGATPHFAKSRVFRRSVEPVDTKHKAAEGVAADSNEKVELSISNSVSNHVERIRNEKFISRNSMDIYEQRSPRSDIHDKASDDLRARYPRKENEVIGQQETSTVAPEIHSSEIPSRYPIPRDRESADWKSYNSLTIPRTTVDCSTSPIPTIELPRRRSSVGVSMGIVRALSPVPFTTNSSKNPMSPEQSTQSYEVTTSSPDCSAVLVGTNAPSTPLCPHNASTSTGTKKPRVKPTKKVDFSKDTIIPDVWKNTSDVDDEANITRHLLLTSPELSISDAFVNAHYDGDVSDIYENKSDITSPVNMDMIDEKELWMKEELELARKEELAEIGDITKLRAGRDEQEEWRQHAMALLNDDCQRERDMEMVVALNKRLEGLRDLHESDRQRAIDCIERHQRNLDGKEAELSALLDNALEFLKNLDIAESSDVPAVIDQHIQDDAPSRMVPSEELKVQSSCDDETDELMANRQRFHSPGDFISERLGQVMANNGQSFTRTTFEQRVVTSGGGGGSPHGGGRPMENRGHGSLNNPGGRIPYCEACKQQIKGAFVLATGLTWCPEHFVCAYRGCGRRLLECGFVEEHGSKYCESCFEAHIAPRCAKCSKPIVADCLNAMQKKWHPTCFTCAHCRKPFGNTAFYLENGLAYCENDWNELFTTKCVACKYPIEAGDRWVEALGNAFHSNCFNCTRCHSNLEGESFFARNGQPYCKMHA